MDCVKQHIKSPVVSILIPIYNVEGYIEMAARSLMEQSYEECRYIFVDDCSTDESLRRLNSTIEDYPHRREQITIITNAENRGVGAVRNQLLDAAEGDYILFVDSDDWVEHITVESMVTRAVVSRADIVRSWRVEEFGESRSLDRVGWLDKNPRSSLRAVLEQSHLFPNYIHGLLIARELIERHAIRFPLGINMGEDYTLLSKLLYYAQRVEQLNMPLYHYRCNREGSYMSQISQSSLKSYIAANRDVTNFFTGCKDGEEFRQSLVWGKLNIKKWIYRRGRSVVEYDEEVMQGMQPNGILQKSYDWALRNELSLVILVLFGLSTIWLTLAINFSKFKSERSNRQKKMWG